MCDYCAAVLNDAKIPENLIEYPLMLGSSNFESELGTFDVWISNDGDLSAYFSFGTLDVESVRINYCPMCGENLNELRKKKEEEANKKKEEKQEKQEEQETEEKQKKIHELGDQFKQMNGLIEKMVRHPNEAAPVTLITRNGDMEYTPYRHRSTLAKGFRGPYEFAVISFGTHPCCYIRIPYTHPLFGKSGSDVQIFENEITYVDEYLKDVDDYLKDIDSDGKSWWIGWDHAHCTDYIGFVLPLGINFPFFDIGDNDKEEKPKKWTTDEMIKECLTAINVLIAREGKK